MADDDGVGADGAQGVAGVEQRLAFFNARSNRLNQDRVRAQRLGGKFEGAAGAGGSFVKEENDAPALEQGPGLVRVHAPGEFQDLQDLGGFEMLDAEQGSSGCVHEVCPGPRPASWLCRPSRRSNFGGQACPPHYYCFSINRTFSTSSTSRSLTSIIWL